jgi:hypothetical protein
LPDYIQSVKDAIEILNKQISSAPLIRDKVKEELEKRKKEKTPTEVQV